MHARKNRINRLQLGRAQAAPAQGINDVILERRVKLFEFNHALITIRSQFDVIHAEGAGCGPLIGRHFVFCQRQFVMLARVKVFM